MSNSTPSDEELAKAAIGGDANALELLLARLEAPIRQTLVTQLPARFRSAFDVDDVIQVTFIEVFLRAAQFAPRGNGSFKAWVTTLARNNLRDAIKELQAAKRVPRSRLVAIGTTDDSYEGLLHRLGASATTPSGASAILEAKGLLETALTRLPPDYERVVRLIDFEGQTGPQAAEAMGRSVGAIYMLRLRAHDQLRELLGQSGLFFSSGS